MNLVGGLKVREPASDLAVAAAVASALRDQPIDQRTVCLGELGLGGELRRVQRIGPRLKEAERLGFTRVVLPEANRADVNGSAMEIVGAADLRTALKALLGAD